MKKALVLAGKPIGSCELVEALKENGIYTIVADYLTMEASPAKRIADEHWDVSTAEVDKLCELCRQHSVDAVLTAVHEFNIEKKIEICEKLGLPTYCDLEQWRTLFDKKLFKDLCSKFEIPVATTYSVERADDIPYPVIVKPSDSGGSRGFSICRTKDDLLAGIENARKFSDNYLIEEFVDSEAGIIHYTAVNGEIYFSGMSDKHSQLLPNGASVMAFQSFPSVHTARYLNDLNEKAIKMFQSIGIENGPIWIEVFIDLKNDRFVFNEMGYRFGGSMTNYPVQYFYGIDQMQLMIDNALGVKPGKITGKLRDSRKNYCILPLHVAAGTIRQINGVEQAKKAIYSLEQIVLVHGVGDVIENWGTAQNVFCYLHILYEEERDLVGMVKQVLSSMEVLDENGKQMLFLLYDIDSLMS